MTDDELSRGTAPRLTSWGAPEDRQTMHRLAEDIRDRSGFGVCAIEVLRHDGMLEFAAIVGSPDGAAALLGRASPPEAMHPLLASGQRYGQLHFVPVGEQPQTIQDSMAEYGWIPDVPETGDPDQWLAEDMLVAEVTDDRGEMRGLVYLDEPVDGRRPTPEMFEALSERIELGLIAVLTTIEREALSHQLRAARAAREVIRRSATDIRLAHLLDEADEHLRAGLRATALRLVIEGPDTPKADPVDLVDLPEALLAAGLDAGRRAWRRQQVIVVEADGVWGDEELATDHGAALRDHLSAQGLATLVLIPVGAGPSPLGVLLLARTDQRWTDSEDQGAIDVGHDLGRAIHTSRAFERELSLNDELQELDDYRTSLIATIAHELKNPINVITGHLELVRGLPELPALAQPSVRAIERGTDRLTSLVSNLLELSRLGQNVRGPVLTRVPLAPVLADVVELADVDAARHDVHIDLDCATDAVAAGDGDELLRLFTNLVSNAVKYSDPGGRVRVEAARHDEVVQVVCADEGVGISEEDQRKLFTEFFRSTNIEALKRPGTGLGLAIVRRIVERHAGSISVDSRLGEGTTITVTLPAG